MQKILVIKLGALGDFVLELGGMLKVRQLHPDAEITLMTNKAFLSIAQQTGVFDKYIIDNRVSWLDIKTQRNLLREVAGAGFELIYDFQCVSRTEKKYFSALRWAMPHSFTWIRTRRKSAWRVEKKHAWGMGKKTAMEHLFEFPVTDLSFLHGENKHFHELPEKFVVLIPGCSPTHPYKRWPVEYFAELSNRLAERGIRTVILGTAAEADTVDAIVSASASAVSMVNKTSLLDIPDLARKAVAIVGNDTGPTHMSSLSGSYTIAVYDKRTGHCVTRGPRSYNFVSPSTIDLITVDMVWEKLLPILEEAESKKD